MHLTWLDPADPAERELAGFVAVREAARAADAPGEPPRTVTATRAELRHGWDGHPPLAAVALDGDRVIGTAEILLPLHDNTHLAEIDVIVDPLLRRRGLGRALLDLVAERVRQEGRRTLVAGSWNSSPGPAFCAATGFTRAYAESKREQRVRELDPVRLAALRREAEAAAAGYELVTVAGPAPEDLLRGLALLHAAINDAPTDTLDVEDEVFDAARIAAFDRAQTARGMRLHRVLARSRGTGEPAGLTLVAVDADQPGHGSQFDTTVVAAHRGHRLGLLLKLAMLDHLAGAEPQLRSITTWNADSNAHMVRVNELLGYRVVATGSGWQRRL